MLAFFHTGPLPQDAITNNHYNFGLVALSYVIAVLASYLAFDMAGRLRAEKNGAPKWYWLLGGAFAMGSGIWSMHFIGMLAFIMPMPMSYGFNWTALSLVLAILASALALFLMRSKQRHMSYLLLGGILIGIGIVSMHYTGMQAMEGVAISYTPFLFLLSIVIAIVASEFALLISFRSNVGSLRKQLIYKTLGALIMGAAICGMHYTGMAAAVFTPVVEEHATHPMSPYTLAFLVSITTFGIIGVALVASTYKQLLISATRIEKDFLNAILDNLEDAIVACNAKGKVTLLNKAMRKLIELPKGDSVIRNWIDYCQFYHPQSEAPLPAHLRPLEKALEGEKIDTLELVLENRYRVRRNVVIDGQPIVSQKNKKIGAVIVIHDITKQKQMESQLVTQATHDLLTGLPNRMLLQDRIEQAILSAKRNGTTVALLFLDLDHFKLINDNYGHSAGDELLLMVARRLQQSVRESDTVARLGGDEFVVLLTSLDSDERAIAMAHYILVRLSEPFLVANNKTKVTVSIGISSYPKNGEDADILLKNADTAMYRVKAHGRNNIKFFSEEMNLKTIKRLELEQFLYTALENKEYLLYYQPIIDLHTGYIIGFEALLRWQHPTLGLLLPTDFLALTEETGLILPIGEWVLHTACAQAKAWQESGFSRIRMSVNVSGRQINETHFLEKVKEVLAITRLEPKFLELELTESSILQRPAESFQTLTALKELGVNIALDDFGTGYSSLGYLSRLPVSKLKIDSTFVRNIEDNAENAAIVLAIIKMASSLKLKVTAEGMETPSELAFLRFNRCDEVQGYYFSVPLTPEEATQFLKDNPKLDISHIRNS